MRTGRAPCAAAACSTPTGLGCCGLRRLLFSPAQLLTPARGAAGWQKRSPTAGCLGVYACAARGKARRHSFPDACADKVSQGCCRRTHLKPRSPKHWLRACAPRSPKTLAWRLRPLRTPLTAPRAGTALPRAGTPLTALPKTLASRRPRHQDSGAGRGLAAWAQAHAPLFSQPWQACRLSFSLAIGKQVQSCGLRRRQ
jgi:hypothetical protein